MNLTGHHLAELNIGRLLAPTDDPRVADFMANLDRVNGLGKRMPGFVWMAEGSGEPGTGNTEAKIGGDPQFVSNLTVWESVETLEAFVWKTVHKQFYDRRAKHHMKTRAHRYSAAIAPRRPVLRALILSSISSRNARTNP